MAHARFTVVGCRAPRVERTERDTFYISVGDAEIGLERHEVEALLHDLMALTAAPRPAASLLQVAA